MFSTVSASCQPMSSLSTSSSSRIDLFVLCCRHVTPSIFRQHHISKASILFLSDFLIVHPSAPCRNTAHTICFMTLTFSTLLMLLSFQILMSSVTFCRVIYSLGTLTASTDCTRRKHGRNTLSRQTKKTMYQRHRRLDGVQVHSAKGDVSGQRAMEEEDTGMASWCHQPLEEGGRLERERDSDKVPIRI